MASSLALKRLLSSTVVPLSRSVLRPPVASRLLSTNAVRRYDDGENGDAVDLDRRSDRSVSRRRDDFFSGNSIHYPEIVSIFLLILYLVDAVS